MSSIVFVCTGNSCRSPMAAEIAKEILADLGPGLRVLSAGVATAGGQPASAHAQFVMAERGGDLSAHRTTPVSDPQIQSADLLVTMTRSHRETLLGRWPHLASRVLSLGQAAGEPEADVPDPFGGSLEDYEATHAELERLLSRAADTLRARLNGSG